MQDQAGIPEMEPMQDQAGIQEMEPVQDQVGIQEMEPVQDQAGIPEMEPMQDQAGIQGRKDKGTHMAAQDENKKNINAENPADDAAAESDIIELTDDRGEKIRFELLDIVEYSAEIYAVAVPADTDSDEVTIFRIENDPKDENVQTLTPETRTSTAQAVFSLFRDRNADRFDFD